MRYPCSSGGGCKTQHIKIKTFPATVARQFPTETSLPEFIILKLYLAYEKYITFYLLR